MLGAACSNIDPGTSCPWATTHSVSHRTTHTLICITYLKATQALTELLAELHVHFSLAHHMFAKLLSRQTTLREERLPLCTPLCCDLGTRCLCLLCGFA